MTSYKATSNEPETATGSDDLIADLKAQIANLEEIASNEMMETAYRDYVIGRLARMLAIETADKPENEVMDAVFAELAARIGVPNMNPTLKEKNHVVA